MPQVYSIPLGYPTQHYYLASLPYEDSGQTQIILISRQDPTTRLVLTVNAPTVDLTVYPIDDPTRERIALIRNWGRYKDILHVLVSEGFLIPLGDVVHDGSVEALVCCINYEMTVPI